MRVAIYSEPLSGQVCSPATDFMHRLSTELHERYELFLVLLAFLRQVLAASGKNLNAQLVFQLLTCLLIPGCDV